MRKYERRLDTRSARIVGEGLRLHKSLGRNFALQHLNASGVPEHVIRAVLALSFDRRERVRRKETDDVAPPSNDGMKEEE
jgi:hypothetical protein